MREATVILKQTDLDGEPILERTPETDALAEELIRHEYLDRFPDGTAPEIQWVRHYQPDCWLLFAVGTAPEMK